MRAAERLLWVLVLSVLTCMGLTVGCKQGHYGMKVDDAAAESNPADDPGTTSGDTDLPGGVLTDTNPPAVCAGKCLPQPQIPFNARIHMVWIGSSASVPDCPAIAPLSGFEGYVVSMSGMQDPPDPGDPLWVQECLISTDSGPCDAGLTCAPLPPDDYRLCLSRENAGPCPEQTYPERIVAEETGNDPAAAPVTLCCVGNPLLPALSPGVPFHPYVD